MYKFKKFAKNISYFCNKFNILIFNIAKNGNFCINTWLQISKEFLIKYVMILLVISYIILYKKWWRKFYVFLASPIV